MQRRALILAAVAIGVVGTAQAGDMPTREEGIGMLSGAAGGALIGGPPGAIIGFALGAFVGDRVEIAKQAERRAGDLEAQLAGSRTELARTKDALSEARNALAQARAAAEQRDAEEAEFLAKLARRLSTDVLFRTGSAELDPDAEGRLKRVAEVLAPLDGVALELHGFADPRGDASTNQKLSEERARRVSAVLRAGGLAESRLNVIAHGEDLSTATAGDAEAYAWERRVTLGVVSTEADKVAQADSAGEQ